MRLADGPGGFLETMVGKFLSLCNKVTDFNLGAKLLSFFEGVAAALEEQSVAQDGEFLGLYTQSASGEPLTKRGAEMGLPWKDEAKARGWERFTGAAETEIDEGTIVSTDRTVEPVAEYKTLEAASIPPGGTFVDVLVEALVAGPEGNRQPDQVTILVSAVPGITGVTNPSAISGGRGPESEEEYRLRLGLRWHQLSYGGTENSFEATALEVQGVARAVCVPLWNGPGTVKVLIWSQDAEGALVPASSELVEEAQEYFGGARRPICCQVTVAAPVATVVDVFVYLEAEAGQWAAAESNARAAIVSYFATPGLTVVRPAMIAAAAVTAEHVLDVRVAKPLSNVAVDAVVLGKLEIRPMDWDDGFGL